MELAKKINVSAIIVCYYPNHDLLVKLINIINMSVKHIYICNNGGLDLKKLEHFKKINYYSFNNNVGLGLALNEGCRLAAIDDIEYVITFDQDSLPDPGMIEILLNDFIYFKKKNIAAIGPMLYNETNNKFNKFNFHRLDINTIPSTQDKVIPVSHLITSGCLFKLSIWKSGFKFDDNLFIDFIDNNWCWRLTDADFLIAGSLNTKMHHQLSDGIKNYKYLKFNTYKPLRRYYQNRNAVYHLFFTKTSLQKKKYIVKSIIISFLSALISDSKKFNSLSAATHGVIDGLLKKMGRK
jgi:rhamnosyltransferase